jgi:hypothetical protein
VSNAACRWRAAGPRGLSVVFAPLTTEIVLSKNPKEMQEKAEASFKRKETQAREATKAMADYQAASAATREKTARLRALRLAQEAKEAKEAEAERDAAAAAKPKPKKSAKTRR